MRAQLLTENRILGGLLALVFISMWVLNPQQFPRVDTFQAMAFQLPELGLLSLAMMIPMLSGGINLSLVATANLVGIVSGLVLNALVSKDAHGVGALGGTCLALLAGTVVAALIGGLNGILVAAFEVSPILATLGTMTLLDGLAVLFTNGGAVSGLPPTIQFLGQGSLLGIPVPMIIFVALAAVTAIGLGRTVPGFNLRMLGANPVASLFSGVRNRRVLFSAYLYSGLLCGVAGLVMLSRFNSAKSGYGSSYLLITVLAAVLGGVNITGGFGKVSGVVLALMILQVLSSGLNLLRVSTYLTLALWGLTLIVVVTLRSLSQSNRVR